MKQKLVLGLLFDVKDYIKKEKEVDRIRTFSKLRHGSLRAGTSWDPCISRSMTLLTPNIVNSFILFAFAKTYSDFCMSDDEDLVPKATVTRHHHTSKLCLTAPI